ncbi:MAG: response regulator transcription factor [Betaproteobacteria bacterium]|nr:response regulator transcription factor [Betaproteobacteria bacterium]MBI2958781.1 response regulator transcription factor [Betaproteobacteria bacterium]
MDIRVLIADDHAVMRDGLAAILEREQGIAVIGSAVDGRDAVSKAKRLAPDIVIMDIVMPELGGIEAAAQIRDHCESTKVIILSMYSTVEHIFRALQAGALGYLLKDCAGAEVVEAVRSVHAGARYLSKKVSDVVVDGYVREHRGASPLESLSPREHEVMLLVVEGRSSTEVAAVLHLSPKTVETYRSRLMQKLGVADLTGLVKFAVEHGLTKA